MIGTLTLGINSGAYVSEIVRGGLMSVDKGRWRRPVPGAELHDHHAVYCHSPGRQGHSARPGQRVYHSAQGHLPHHGHRGKELLYAAQGIYNRTYEQMFPLIGTAALYLVLVIILSWLLGKLERRLRQSDRR